MKLLQEYTGPEAIQIAQNVEKCIWEKIEELPKSAEVAQDNPLYAVAIAGGVLLVAAPGVVSAPALGFAGFSGQGVVGGKVLCIMELALIHTMTRTRIHCGQRPKRNRQRCRRKCLRNAPECRNGWLWFGAGQWSSSRGWCRDVCGGRVGSMVRGRRTRKLLPCREPRSRSRREEYGIECIFAGAAKCRSRIDRSYDREKA
ncbi:hypothetical protein S40288_08304, partial [Stachybotrys chartarum IBT 40288]